jgi:glycosyltransferase involved in cell wall biosynthesis
MDSYEKKLRIIKNNLNVETYKCHINLDKRKQSVGFIGRLSAEKGIMPLLEAAKMIKDSGINFIIAGEGPLKKQVEETIRSPDLSHVSYIGWIEKIEIIKLLNDIRLFILPSAGEGTPYAVLEAMACGTPVLVTKVGGICDLINDKQSGFILPDLKPKTIAKSITEALNYPELNSVAQRGQDYVRKNYSLSVSVTQWKNVLNELIGDYQ